MMGSDDSKKFFRFLSDVLGVKQILTPTADRASVSAQLIISVSELETYTLDEKALLEKMIAALQLGDISYHVQDFKKDISNPMAFYLILTNQIHAGSTQSQNTVTTFSPRKLLQEPNLKKTAWSDMQTLLEKIKNS